MNTMHWMTTLACLAGIAVAQTPESYDADSEKLGKTQREAATDLVKYESLAKKYSPKLASLIAEVVGEMKNVETRLYRPDTGQKTVDKETYIIELIDKSLSECSKCSSACAGALGMMGMKPGQNPGPNGNPMLQPSNMASKAHEGEGEGERAEESEIDNSAGLSASELPDEFRDILESYLNDLEGEE